MRIHHAHTLTPSPQPVQTLRHTLLHPLFLQIPAAIRRRVRVALGVDLERGRVRRRAGNGRGSGSGEREREGFAEKLFRTPRVRWWVPRCGVEARYGEGGERG